MEHIVTGFKNVSKTLFFWQTTILLSVVYYLFVVPMGLFRRQKPPVSGSGWTPWQYRCDRIDDAMRQS